MKKTLEQSENILLLTFDIAFRSQDGQRQKDEDNPLK